MDTDVVIVGGGPNGLLLACELALSGVRPIVLERLAEPSTTPKANGLVGRVVQALDYRGLYEPFSGSGAAPEPTPFFQFGALHLDMSTMDGNALYALPVPQRTMEELLEKRAHGLGVEIRREHKVVELNQDAERVALDVRGPDGLYRLTAKFAVGADGARSVVRKRSGIGFPGFTDEGFTTRMAQVAVASPVAKDNGQLEVPGLGALHPATFTRTEHGVFAFGTFQPGVYRIAVIEWGRSPLGDSTEMPLEELREATARVLGSPLPVSALPEEYPKLSTRATTGMNSRLADRYRKGRVLLVGDAAHVQSGVGGPGLNLGLQDSLNLGWKLAAEVSGWAPDGLLDSYQSERRPVGERVIMHSRAQTALLSGGPNITALRQVFDELLRDQNNVRHISDLMSGADTHYDMRGSTHPMTGRWMPDLPLGPTRVAEVLRPGRPVLLVLADRADLVDAAAGWAARVDVVAATTARPPADAVLIRPDGYVAWAGGPADGLPQALRTWFGEPA